MAAAEEQRDDFYAVMGLKKECTIAELRSAYKKLAMKWHPDRCSASANPKYVEESKKKFQTIQQAYSVLSDANKRFLYDVGVYDCDDDDDENGMGDFLSEMAAMMSQNKTNEKRNESFQDLQQLFEEIFHSETDGFGSSCRSAIPPSRLSSQDSCSETYSAANKRSSSDMASSNSSIESSRFGGFCVGVGHQENVGLGRVAGERTQKRAGGSRRKGRKQKIASGRDVSSSECSSVPA